MKNGVRNFLIGTVMFASLISAILLFLTVTNQPPIIPLVIGSLFFVAEHVAMLTFYFTKYIAWQKGIDLYKAEAISRENDNIAYRQLLFGFLCTLSLKRNDIPGLGELLDTFYRQLGGVKPDATTLRLVNSMRKLLKDVTAPPDNKEALDKIAISTLKDDIKEFV
jgi:hypothetical protein